MKYFLLFTFSTLLCVNASVLPTDFIVTGESETTARGLLASGDKPMTVTGDIPEEQPVLVFRGRVGKGGNEGLIRIEVKDTEGQTATLALRSLEYKIDGKTYPDAVLSIGWQGGLAGWGQWHFRPRADYYRVEEWKKREAQWAALPNAAEHSFKLEMRPVGDEVEVWVEDQFMHVLPLGMPISCRLVLPSRAVLEELRFESVPESRVLPVEKYARAGVMARAKLHFAKDADLPKSFRELADGERTGISVGELGTFSQWRNDDLRNFFWRRHAAQGFPEQRMFSVPLDAYSHAWVLLAREEDSEKTNTFTFRVTRYGNDRGTAMSDTLVEEPSIESADARRVGTVSYGTLEARKESPLWLVRVPIYNGLIEDILYDDQKRVAEMRTHRYLDVELLDPLKNVEASRAFPPSQEVLHRQWRPTNPKMAEHDVYPFAPPATSGVTVFGIQLEASPAEMRVRSNPVIKAFYETEKAEFLAEVWAEKAGNYRVEWKVADVEGRIVDASTQVLKLEAGASGEAKLALKKEIGWFAIQARLLAPDGSELVDKQSAYAMLPPDTRKAGYESPFYGWWFASDHASPLKPEEFGPLLQRLGMRRAELRPDEPESLTSKYGFTNPTVNWNHGKFPGLPGGLVALRDFTDGKLTLEEALAMHEASIRGHLELWPHIDHMLVFHESRPRGAPFPSEIWGEPARNFASIVDENSPEALLRREGETAAVTELKAQEEWEKWWPKRIEYLTAMAKMVREKFPNLKIQYGNDGNSLGIVGELFRQKFPREYIDSVAVEDLGQTIVPENPRLGAVHSAWFLRELARKMGYGDVPVMACTEWIGRMTEKLGHRTQAEWKVRDGLLALAYGFETISIGGLNDAGNGYYYSIWGNGGLTGRWPELAPKPSYAAVATLTQVLDHAKFVRFVPTGSTVLYAQEFQRDAEWIYAFWTPRGTREMKLEFGNGGERRSIDLWGREKRLSGEALELKAGTAVQYLVSSDRLTSITAGVSAFPDDPMPEKVLAEIPLDSLEVVEAFYDPKPEAISRGYPPSLPHRRQGKFEVREVEDPEMGQCLEVELIPEGERWEMEHEYITLRLKTPVETDAKNAGIWIKGNGSWGEINIEKTQPWGPWATNGNLNMNWSGNQMLNFDGWNFLHYPYYDWIREINNSITGIQLTLPRKTIVGTEMQPVESLKVRIKKIVLF